MGDACSSAVYQFVGGGETHIRNSRDKNAQVLQVSAEPVAWDMIVTWTVKIMGPTLFVFSDNIRFSL